MTRNGNHMPDRWQRIIQRVARGEDWPTAARAECRSGSYARVIRTRMMKNPEVVKAIESIRAEGRKSAAYDLVAAMKEANDAAAFARQHKNPMALVKATELRAKLSGLLVDQVQIVTVDLTGALARAEARVLNATLPPNGALAPVAPLPLPSKTAIRWRAPIPGDGEDQETGPADGQANN